MGIRQGDWVIIKGAELVNPAILERLNGLLEEKEVYINEAIGTGEDIEILRKHDKFRVFIMYDLSRAKQAPSRALRNRCIEINMSNYDLPETSELAETTKATQDKHLIHDDIHLSALINSVLKYSTEPLDLQDKDVILCEKFVNIERTKSTHDILEHHFSKFFNSGQSDNWTIESYSSMARLLNKSISELNKTVHYRSNFSFSSIPQQGTSVSSIPKASH